MFVSKSGKRKFYEFPNNFRELLGSKRGYEHPSRKIFSGVVTELRWSNYVFIMNQELKYSVKLKGIELKIENEQYGDFIWTEPFVSGIIYHDDDYDLLFLN